MALQSKLFLRWAESPVPSGLWLYGRTRCGKTNLMSIVIQYLLDLVKEGDESIDVDYFYFDRSEAKQSDSEEAVRSMVKQLAVA